MARLLGLKASIQGAGSKRCVVVSRTPHVLSIDAQLTLQVRGRVVWMGSEGRGTGCVRLQGPAGEQVLCCPPADTLAAPCHGCPTQLQEMAREEVERQRKGTVFASPSGGNAAMDEQDPEDLAFSLPSHLCRGQGRDQRSGSTKEPYNWQRWVKRREPEGAEGYQRPVAFVPGSTLHDASPEQGVMVIQAPRLMGGDSGVGAEGKTVDASSGRGRDSIGGFDAHAAVRAADAPGSSAAVGQDTREALTSAAEFASYVFLFNGEAVLDYVRLAYTQDPLYSSSCSLHPASDGAQSVGYGRSAVASLSQQANQQVASALQQAATTAATREGCMPNTVGAQQQQRPVFSEGLWRLAGSVCVPNCAPLRHSLLATAHQSHSQAAGCVHAGEQATLAALERLGFWWPGVEAAVRSYVGTCAICATQESDGGGLGNGGQRRAQLEVVAEQEGQDEEEGASWREAAKRRGRAWMQQLMADEDEEGAGAGATGALAEEEDDEGVAEREDNVGHHPRLDFGPAER